jgi:hypothetical protein
MHAAHLVFSLVVVRISDYMYQLLSVWQKYCKQTEGLAIGAPVSVVLAEMYSWA